MVMPWFPCIECTNAIISSGITRLVMHEQMIMRSDERWIPDFIAAAELMTEARVEMLIYSGKV